MAALQEAPLFRDIFQYIAQRAFQHEERQTGRVSALRTLAIRREPDYSDRGGCFEHDIRVVLESGTTRDFSPYRFHYSFREDPRPLHDYLEQLRAVLEAREGHATLLQLSQRDALRAGLERIFAVEREEILFELNIREARREFEEAARLALPDHQLCFYQHRYYHRMQELLTHRNRAGERSGRAVWRDGPPARVQATANLPPSEYIRRLHEQMLGSFGMDLAGPEGDQTIIAQRQQEAARLKEAQARGLKLLKEHLTPAQLTEYERHNYFHVTGGDTKRTYRILHGRQINIRELGAEGKVVAKLCFLPGGDLVEGDVMLAQKFALELQETACLKIANRYPPEVVAGRDAQLYVIDEVASVPAEAFERAALWGRSYILPQNMIVNPTRIVNTDATS